MLLVSTPPTSAYASKLVQEKRAALQHWQRCQN
jgi:hypothetical protein